LPSRSPAALAETLPSSNTSAATVKDNDDAPASVAIVRGAVAW
jgi:hypothetical protein